MHVAVQRLSKEQALARWAELCNDPELAKLEAPFEMDEFGEPYMTPPPSLRHQLISDALAQQSREQLGGRAIVGCPVYAGKTYLADVAWMPDEQVSGEPPPTAVAPPLVVEVLSPGNTAQGIAAKTQAYLEHGVREVVQVQMDGRIRYFSADGETPVSQFGINLKLP
jgi:Uma2 family endonuclease